jgi:hypothetical protein
MARKRPGTPKAATVPVHLGVTHQLDLEHRDWMRATWRSRQPVPLPTLPRPAPFDRDACLARLAAIPVNEFGWWEWQRLELLPALSREEAQFWLLAILGSRRSFAENVTPQEVADRLARQNFEGRPSLDEIEQAFAGGTPSAGQSLLFQTLLTLLTPVEILHLLRRGPGWSAFVGSWDWAGCALDWFAHDVLPHISNEELDEVRLALRQQISSATWTRNSLEWPDPVFHLGALVGLHDEMLAIVTGRDWPVGHPHYHRPHDIVFGLGTPALVVQHMRRLRLQLEKPEYVRAWLAHTELSELDFVRDSILEVKNKKEAVPLVEALAVVRAPEVPPVMLELKRSSKAPQVARHWLDREVGNAVSGLLAVAAGQGPLAEDAREYLQEAQRKGHAAVIQEQMERARPDISTTLSSFLDPTGTVSLPFDDTTTPAWLSTALAAIKKAGKSLAWINLPTLPPIVVGKYRLADAQVVAVLAVLKASPLGTSPPLIAGLKHHADAQSIETFAWKVLGAWVADGAPASGKWAVTALGHLLTSDPAILKLADLVRTWPTEGQHRRAVHGLECLRAINSTAARNALGDIAREMKFKTLRDRAQELLSTSGPFVSS